VALKEMYPGMINSPETTITNNINESDTIIYVLDPARVPEPPNLMTLGTGTNAETVKVLEINDNAITVERGFQGVAKSWPAGTVIARNFTEYDYNALKENIEDLEATKETPQGAQAKANAAENAAKQYADQRVNALAGEGNTKTVKQIDDELASHLAEDVTQAGGVHGLVVESGVWTPQLRGYEAGDDGNTYEIQNGTYLRIGSIVFFTFEIKLSAKSPDMLNKAEIKGLPFYSKNRFNVGISFYNDINITSGIVSARTVNNVIPLYKQDSDSYESLLVSSITDTTHIQGSGLIEL